MHIYDYFGSLVYVNINFYFLSSLFHSRLKNYSIDRRNFEKLIEAIGIMG